MQKWLHHKCFQFSEQQDIDCIGKYISVEKMPNMCFHEAQIFWNDISQSFPREFLYDEERCSFQPQHIPVNAVKATFLQR